MRLHTNLKITETNLHLNYQIFMGLDRIIKHYFKLRVPNMFQRSERCPGKCQSCTAVAQRVFSIRACNGWPQGNHFNIIFTRNTTTLLLLLFSLLLFLYCDFFNYY